MRVAGLLIALAVVAAVALSPRLRALERLGLLELSELGAYAPLVLIQGYVLVSILPLPSFPLDLAAGAHFGFFAGVFWVQVAATGGSVIGYLLGRTVLRRFVERFFGRRPKLRLVRDAVEREGWRVVLLTRLSPVLSFSLLSLFYGAARFPLGPYVLASFVGMLPGTAMYVYAGEVAGDLAAGEAGPQPGGGWLLEGAGLALAGLVVVVVTRRASRLLQAAVERGAPPPAA